MATSAKSKASGSKLTVAILESELGPVAAKWKILGRKLGLQEWRMENIAADHPVGDGASLQRLSAVLREWCNNVIDGSWSNIICALKEMKENVLARGIEEKYYCIVQGVSQKITESQQEQNEEAAALVHTNKVMMKDRFARLLTMVYLRIQERLDAKEIKVRDFRVYMTTLFPPGECIPDTSDVSEIFTAITHNCLWDYLNYEPLERVAKMYGGKAPDIMEKLEIYVQDLNGYKVVVKMADCLTYVPVTSSSESEDEDKALVRKDQRFRRELTVKLKIPITTQSLAYIDEIWNSLAKRFLLPPSSAILDKIIEGSLYITWLIPAFFVPQMMEIAELHDVVGFFQEMKAELAIVDGVCLYSEQKVSSDDSLIDKKPEIQDTSFPGKSEDAIADQHHDTQAQSSSVYGIQTIDEKTLSSKQNELCAATDSFQEEVGSAAEGSLQNTSPGQDECLDAEDEAIKLAADESSSHSNSHPHSCQPQFTGYDVELVKESPDLRCPICLLVFHDPMQVNCCGKRFCRACIEPLIAGAKPCPACKHKAGDFDTFEDKAQKQAILEVKVYCSNKKLGCAWRGELCQLENHLNLDPEIDKIDMACQYAEIKCIYCSRDYHVSCCPWQPFTCPYCRQYSATYEDVSKHHFSVCEEFPIVCKLCSVKMPQWSHPNHQLVCVRTEDLLPTIVSSLRLTTSEVIASPPPVFVPPPSFIMPDFMSYKKNRLLWHSPPIYSHIGGYKLCLRTYANGYGKGAGMHVSVAVCLMRGEYDSNLIWPFRGTVTFSLVNRGKDEGHVEYTVPFDDHTPIRCAHRVTGGERAEGWGLQQFIPHTALDYNESWNTMYLSKDTLEFRITQVKLSRNTEVFPIEVYKKHSRDIAGTEQPELSSTPPINFIMSNFISHMLHNSTWYSPPFYSHIRGYKMCLSVEANGDESAIGMCVSVFLHLMCGEYDNSLTWPFRGNITIQIVNQRCDRKHVEHTITFDNHTPDICAGQVTGQERAIGRGYGFIPHSALHHDEFRDTEYLKSDCLQFQITQVKLATPIAEHLLLNKQ